MALTLDSVPSTTRRMAWAVFQVSAPVTVPTTGNTTVVSGGVSLTVDRILDLGSSVYDIRCIVPDTAALQNDSTTGYAWTITVDAENVVTGNIPFLPRAGWSYVDLVSPTTTSSLLTGYAAVVAVTGDQLEYEDRSYPEGLTYTGVNADSTYTLSATPFLELNLDRRVVQVAGTVAATETLTQTVTTTATVNDDISFDTSPVITGTCNVNHAAIDVTADPGSGDVVFETASIGGTWSIETAPYEVAAETLAASGAGIDPLKTYMISPNLITLSSGEILLVYTADTTHDAGEDDYAYGRIYDQDMNEIVSEFLIHSNPTSGTDHGGPRGIQGGVLDSGRLVLFWIVKDVTTSPDTYLRCETIYSDDDARTFSSVQQIQSLFPSETTGYIPFSSTVKTSYTSAPYMQEFDHVGFCYVAYSSDGITWGDLVTVYDKGAGVDGYNWVEFKLSQIDEDRMVLVARSQLQPEYYGHWKTFDGGRTWSTSPTVALQHNAIPNAAAPIAFQTIGERVLISWGARTPVDLLYTKWMSKEEFFNDPGVAWSDATGSQFIYANTYGDPLLTFNFGYPSILEKTGVDYTAHLVWYDQAEASLTNQSTTDIRYMTFPRPR